jgi:RimJ/RimL family protein N-acetyltransferase
VTPAQHEAQHEAPHEAPPAGAAAALAARVASVIPTLATPRLRLRAPRVADFAAWAAIVTTVRGVHVGGPLDRADAWLDLAQYVAGWTLRGHGLWSVERAADGVLLGFVLLGFEPGDLEPELGFLFLAEAEGQGYAREAAEAARGFAFGALGWDTLVSYVDPANDRSIRLAERLGARLDPAPLEGARVYRHRAPEGRA